MNIIIKTCQTCRNEYERHPKNNSGPDICLSCRIIKAKELARKRAGYKKRYKKSTPTYA